MCVRIYVCVCGGWGVDMCVRACLSACVRVCVCVGGGGGRVCESVFPFPCHLLTLSNEIG